MKFAHTGRLSNYGDILTIDANAVTHFVTKLADMAPKSPIFHDYDVLILGSGAAGLSLALKLANYAKVAVLSKTALTEGATYYAQGGMSAVLDEHDSIESHVEDTLLAGGGLCNQEVVRFVVERAHKSIDWLVEQGVDFTRTDNEKGKSSSFHLHKEGGHSHRRIIHAADATGKEIETASGRSSPTPHAPFGAHLRGLPAAPALLLSLSRSVLERGGPRFVGCR